MTEFNVLAARIAAAAVCEDLYGVLGDPGAPVAAQLRALAKAHKHIACIVHPDARPRAESTKAHATFIKAGRLRDEAESKIHARTYGDRAHGSDSVMITMRGRAYTVGAVIARGDICNLHACSFVEEGRFVSAVLKIARAEADNDLVENEAAILERIWPPAEPEEKFLRYFPRLQDSFGVRTESGTVLRANVLPRFAGYVSLADVRAAYPAGLDFRDVAWMAKRAFAALGFLHRLGLVHGALILSHVLVHPRDHGAKLVDFSYAVESGACVRALASPSRALYAPEILRKEPATSKTDIFMLARSVLALLDWHAPKPFRTFFETCAAQIPARRPSDGWALHEELDALLTRLVGRPRYRPLDIKSSHY